MSLLEVTVDADLAMTWAIGAQTQRVWKCLTDPRLLPQWLGTLVSGNVEHGDTFVVDHGDGYCCSSTVSGRAAPHLLEFSWEFPDEPRSDVGVDLTAADGNTILRLVHSGLGASAPSYRDGWCTHLTYLEAAASGTPLPASMFWQLHGTIARLARRADRRA